MSKNSSTAEPVLRDEKRLRKWYQQGEGQKPLDVNGQMATRTDFYRDRLRIIVKSMFDIECPLEWDTDYQLDLLFGRGFYVISRTPQGAILPVKASLTGLNYISMPTTAVMATPVLGNWENDIGVDCELVYLERHLKTVFYKLDTLIYIFAQRLASADAAIDTNLFNSKIAYAVEAETKAQADTIKTLFDRVSNGEPLVVYRKDSITSDGLKLFFGNVKNTYIANDIQDTKRSIVNEFLTVLGINNANTDKKERLISSEVDSNIVELKANVAHWKYTLEKQVKRIKRVFPDLDFNISLRYDPDVIYEQAREVSSNVSETTAKE